MADGRLVIDGKYYNEPDIDGFSRMMKGPSYCYKFYRLEAIVQLSELPANASKIEIMNATAQFDKQLHGEKQALTLNVPYKALSGFANKSGERISLDSSAGRMIIYYNKLSANDILLPYTFGAETGLKRRLIFNDAWMQMIKDNTVNILGWIQCEKVKWLQNNNPEVPGLIYKLALPRSCTEEEIQTRSFMASWRKICALCMIQQEGRGMMCGRIGWRGNLWILSRKAQTLKNTLNAPYRLTIDCLIL